MTVLHEDADVVEVRHQFCAWDPLRFHAANGVSPERLVAWYAGSRTQAVV